MRLVDVVHRPLQIGVAALWLLGAILAGVTAPFAASRIDVAAGLVFAAVAAAAVVLAVCTVLRKRWALLIGLIGCGGQVLGVVGTVWELAYPLNTPKSLELQALGIDPTLAVAINLAYSTAASVLFAWMAVRAIRLSRGARHPRPETTQD